MPCATFLFSKTGSPLSSQDPFSHENVPHTGGGPAFLRAWPWSRGGRTEKETTHSFGCPLQLLLAAPLPAPTFLRGPTQALQLTGGSGFRACPPCLRSGSLTLSTSQEKGNASLQLQSQQGTFSLLNPATNMENSLSPGSSHRSP